MKKSKGDWADLKAEEILKAFAMFHSNMLLTVKEEADLKKKTLAEELRKGYRKGFENGYEKAIDVHQE